MRCAILADIHANLSAFEAVLNDAESRGGFDELWCLGDVVGYGPEPHACIELLRSCKHSCIAGNHDWAAVSKVSILDFNPDAAQACRWTAQQLTPEDLDYLQNLPLKLSKGDFTLVHGSPRQPIWEYLLVVDAACDNFSYFGTRFCLVGHSHVPLLFRQETVGTCLMERIPGEIELGNESHRLIINPGGVGQPRDGDPRASYAIYDGDSQVIHHYRVSYDIAATQKKMKERGLSLSLISRLHYGY